MTMGKCTQIYCCADVMQPIKYADFVIAINILTDTLSVQVEMHVLLAHKHWLRVSELAIAGGIDGTGWHFSN